MLSLNLIFAILWTIDPVITGMHRRHLYKFPIDIWRIFTFCGGVISVVIIIVLEIKSIKLSLNRRKNWRKWRLSEMNRDLIYCHPKYLDEELFIKHKISELKNMANMYLKDPCNFNRNILDWSVIVMIIVCSISHMVDVVHHSISIARFNLRFTSITIIMLWVRLMKYVKPYTVIGPFVVMLTLLLKDILKFFYLYMQFYIPYACAFWMLFGGSKVYEKYIYIQPNTPDQITQIPGWETPGIALWTLFRITLVDEYSFEDLASLDSVMALLMIFTWIMISGVLILNLFIALMSDSFQRIHDNAHAVAKMQQAILLSDIENNFQNDREKLEYSNIMKTEYSDISTTYNEEEIDIQKEMRDSILQLQYELSDLTKFVKEHIKT
ncbi:hypothetical protein A3Q56_04422 [Intoshia linei]|uniref:Ion transport domain-containing protein n=1 Tax=Intoshia linei TaxID=1819745 RepID=A0A177B2V2_9BILA|nr:hypothetical protein A3Q56_04422 [Intoshia linei]